MIFPAWSQVVFQMAVVVLGYGFPLTVVGVWAWPRVTRRVAGWFQAGFDEDEAKFIENEERAMREGRR